jgi:very-short-patch-repair endonuclease
MANERARQLRTNSTDAERKLWRFLRSLKEQGFHFRRQVPIDHFIVDFACYSARLVIEVDGGQHNMADGRRTDAARDEYLRRHDFKLLRFWNNDVVGNIDGVAWEIRFALGLDTPPPTPPRKGEGSRTQSFKRAPLWLSFCRLPAAAPLFA